MDSLKTYGFSIGNAAPLIYEVEAKNSGDAWRNMVELLADAIPDSLNVRCLGYTKFSKSPSKGILDKVIFLEDETYLKLSDLELTEKFIAEHADVLNLHDCTRFFEQNLFTFDFLNRFKHQLDWKWLSLEWKFTEDDIRRFQDVVDWSNISFSQKMSMEFLEEFYNKIDLYSISQNKNTPKEFKKKYIKELHDSFLKGCANHVPF